MRMDADGCGLPISPEQPMTKPKPAADRSSVLRAIRECIWVIVGRESGTYSGDTLEVAGRFDAGQMGLSVFVVSDLLAVTESIGQAKKLAAQLPSNYEAKKPLKVALRVASDAIADADILAASHFRAGAFATASAIAGDASDRVLRDAGPDLIRLAAAMGLDSNRESAKAETPSGGWRRWPRGHKPTLAEKRLLERDAKRILRANQLITRDALAIRLGVSFGYISNDCEAWKSRGRHKGRRPRADRARPRNRLDLGVVLDNVGSLDPPPDDECDRLRKQLADLVEAAKEQIDAGGHSKVMQHA
jgi:hypothetical protein